MSRSRFKRPWRIHLSPGRSSALQWDVKMRTGALIEAKLICPGTVYLCGRGGEAHQDRVAVIHASRRRAKGTDAQRARDRVDVEWRMSWQQCEWAARLE